MKFYSVSKSITAQLIRTGVIKMIIQVQKCSVQFDLQSAYTILWFFLQILCIGISHFAYFFITRVSSALIYTPCHMLCTLQDFIVFGYIYIVSFITHYKKHFLSFFLLAVNWSRVFQYRVGSGGVLQQNRVTGELRSGRNAEIFDRVFQGTFLLPGISWYVRYIWEILNISDVKVFPKCGLYLNTG